MSQFETIAVQAAQATSEGVPYQGYPRGSGRSIAASRQVMALRRDSSAVWNQESFQKRSR